MRTRQRNILLGGTALFLWAAAGASAQIETVVVTAEKRAEDLQKVPVAITAFSERDLEDRGVTGFKELSAVVPSLRFGAGVTGGENVITMRGLGSQNTTPGGDSPVAYISDGVYLQRTTAIDPEFFDEHVEVLRGPQGTLYGRNSMGGTINVVSNRPTDTLAGGVDAEFGDYAQRTLRGWVSGPLMDGEGSGGTEVLFRLTGIYAAHDPYADNLSSKPSATHNQDAQDFYMGRAQMQVNFNSDVSLLLLASVNHNNDIAAANTAWWEAPTRYIDPPLGIALGSKCDFHTEALYDPRKYCHDADERAHNTIQLYNATLNWNLGWGEFTSVTGYSTSQVSQVSDGDGSDLPLALGTHWELRQHQISEEARLSSNDSDAALKWIAGAYYFWSDNFENFEYQDFGYNDNSPTEPFDKFNFLSHGNTATRSWSPFGQVDYDFAKTGWGVPLTLTAGVRYTDDDKYGFNYLDYQLPDVCGGSCGVTQGPFDKEWSQITGTFGAHYQINDALMAYATASRGYLSGGNIIGLANIYGPESMWSYEAGIKSRFWDDKAQLNVAAYHEEIKGLQVFVQSSTQSGINNVDGLTQVNGLETELTLRPTEHLSLNATVTLTSAHYGEYITTDSRFGAPPAGCTFGTTHTLCNFKGNELNQTPPYTVALGAQYAFDTDIGTITPRVDTYLSGRVQFLPDNYFTSTQKAYSKTDLRLTWQSIGGRYRAEAFVYNVEDKAVISNDGLQSVTLGQQVIEPDNFVYYAPRTFGVRLAYNFGG
jgi:iron complex outermembrane receptor protein